MKALVFCLTLLLLVFVNSQAVSAAVVFNHPNPQAGAEFGTSMALVGDINGDGVPDLLVGAPKQNVGGNTDQGQAYLLSGATGALLRTLNNPLPQPGAKFGAAVASAGDIDGDGKNDLFIGAPEQDVGLCQIGDTSGCSVGQAFVFSSVTGNLLLTLNHPTPNSSSFFGFSVAPIGDINGDLVSDLIVGSPGNGLGVFRPSQVFVFSGSNGSLLLTINDPHPSEVESEVGSTFGSVVASVGDVNNDGKPDILVGDAQQDVGGNVDQGQVHVFSGANGALIRTIDHPQPQAGAFFGASAAVVGDLNGDGIGDILVGAPRHDVGLNPDQGRAYLFSGATGALLLTLDDPTPQFAANFGFAVAGTGNLNGDAVRDLLVGAPGQTAGGNSGQGQAFIFSGANGSLLFTLNDPLPQRDANFGRTVASGEDLDGDGKLDPLVAAPFQTVGGNSFQGLIGGFHSSTLGGGNQAPIANAGPDQTVNEGSLVNLNGTASSDPNGNTITFLWTQTAGPTVTLSNPASATPTFAAPLVTVNTVLTFQLVVNDGLLNSSPDTVNVNVLTGGETDLCPATLDFAALGGVGNVGSSFVVNSNLTLSARTKIPVTGSSLTGGSQGTVFIGQLGTLDSGVNVNNCPSGSNCGVGVQNASKGGSKGISGAGGDQDESLIFDFTSGVIASSITVGLIGLNCLDGIAGTNCQAKDVVSLAIEFVDASPTIFANVNSFITPLGGSLGSIAFSNLPIPGSAKVKRFAVRATEGHFGVTGITFTGPCLPSADLSVTKTDSPDPVPAGSELTYTIVVTNNGASAATGVVMTDTLPANVTFVSASSTQGACSGTSTVTCNIGNLANGAGATITIVVKPSSKAKGKTIANTASLKSNVTDPNTADNKATAATKVN